MKTTFAFPFLLIFCGVILCSSCNTLSPDEKLANKITAQTAKKLHNEKGLTLIGTGARMMYDIEMLMMAFEYRKIVDLETARKLLIECVEEYLSMINADEEIRPYLKKYPFIAKNIEITISFRNPNGSDVPVNDISFAAFHEGRITYSICDPKTQRLKSIHEETYDEAIQLIAKNK